MKPILTIAVALILVMTVLSGCTVNPGFNQLEWLRRTASFGAKAELESQLWMLRIGDYQQEAIPVVHDEHLTFYLKDGTEIDFKGWNVIALRNWSVYGSSVTVTPWEFGLTHELIDDSMLRLRCTAYQPSPDIEAGEFVVQSAECSDDQRSFWSYTNLTVSNAKGDAVWMSHHISPEMPPIEMRLNSADGVSEELITQLRSGLY